VKAFVARRTSARYQPEPLADVKLGPGNATWSQNAPGGMKKGMERYEKRYGRKHQPISESSRSGRRREEGGGRREMIYHYIA